MGFAVVHMQKIKVGGVRGIQSHIYREHPPKTNPDINPERTPDNYELLWSPDTPVSYRVKAIIRKFATNTITVRKDAVVLCSFIVTSDEQTMKAMSHEERYKFFQETMLWFAERYGIENLAYATVHMDETTPHIHIGVVPITYEERLSAKSIFDRKEMIAIQTEFARDIGTKYGLQRGVEGSDRTHLSEQRFKAAQASQEAQKAVEVLDDLESKKKALQDEISHLTTQKTVLLSEQVALSYAVKNENEAGQAAYGMDDWQRRIAAARKTVESNNRLKLLENFVKHPKIELEFKQFCNENQNQKQRERVNSIEQR